MAEARIESKQGWFETFFCVLIQPRHTFQMIAERTPSSSEFWDAALLVVLASTIDGLISAGHNFDWWVVLLASMGIISGLAGWLILVFALALMALSFGAPWQRINKSLVLTGWAFLPWIFVAPAYLWHQALGHWAWPISLVPLAWVAWLQILAIKTAYQLRWWQSVLLVTLVPQWVIIAAIWWLSQMLGDALSLLVG